VGGIAEMGSHAVEVVITVRETDRIKTLASKNAFSLPALDILFTRPSSNRSSDPQKLLLIPVPPNLSTTSDQSKSDILSHFFLLPPTQAAELVSTVFSVTLVSSPRKSVLLLSFVTNELTDKIYRMLNSHRVLKNSSRNDSNHLLLAKALRIRSLSFEKTVGELANAKTESSSPIIPLSTKASPATVPEQIIIPSCAVCLNRISHYGNSAAFDPLRPWPDSDCRACKILNCDNDDEEGDEDVRCGQCGIGSTNWVCLICGEIGCGRYTRRHAYWHFAKTGHVYSLEIATSRIWDYVIDDFVQRDDILKNDDINYDNNSGGRGSGSVSDKANIPLSKKAGLVSHEYDCLLSSAMEEQVRYWNELIMGVKAELTIKLFQEQEKSMCASEKEVVGFLRAEIESTQARISDMSKYTAALLEEEQKLKAKTSALLLNKNNLDAKLAQKTREREEMRAEKSDQIEEMEAQKRDLRSFIHVSEQTKNEEAEGGDVVGFI